LPETSFALEHLRKFGPEAHQPLAENKYEGTKEGFTNGQVVKPFFVEKTEYFDFGFLVGILMSLQFRPEK